MAHWENSAGKTDEWYTPKYIFDALGTVFDLDVASPPQGSHCPCNRFYSDGALEKEWTGFIWMNPPFGGRNGLIPWLDKFFSHGDGVALVPDRTSAPWFQEAAKQSDLMLFVSPKIKFETVDGLAGSSPSTGAVLISKGKRACDVLRNASHLGFVVSQPPSQPVEHDADKFGITVERLENDCEWTRIAVPGGWIYNHYRLDSNALTSTFVPSAPIQKTADEENDNE